jgi:hypothetical protein
LTARQKLRVFQYGFDYTGEVKNSVMQQPARSSGEGEIGGIKVGGIAKGDRWQDPGGNQYVVMWIRKLGVLGYRGIDDSPIAENVVDIVKFVQLFRPATSGAGG